MLRQFGSWRQLGVLTATAALTYVVMSRYAHTRSADDRQTETQVNDWEDEGGATTEGAATNSGSAT